VAEPQINHEKQNRVKLLYKDDPVFSDKCELDINCFLIINKLME
jgi:hypothetical protein